ncbi:MAG: class I SAM-dependent RNA methyltransferase [Geodermatophilaceae bacterium]|nr:class I SAM-dependent RNA methyltransferase [Geodermatophilaceae bacterium]
MPALPEPGGFAWRGDAELLLRANVALRISSRILVRLAVFEAKSFAELERYARRIDWARIAGAGDALTFRVTCKKSRLYHSDAVAQRVADAAMRTVPGVRAEGGSVPEDAWGESGEESQLVVVRVSRDQVTVSADSSGALLHRRGYRQATAKAPLRETLAAALLAASEWDGASPLVDPLCGSGTIPIEGALMARRLAPGTKRTFAAERWPGVARGLGDSVRQAAQFESLARAPGAIVGTDRDAGAVQGAISNAERAEVTDDVEWATRSISALALPDGARGWIVSNPPYGVRVGDMSRVRDLWAQLGQVLRARAPGWRVALLSPDPALERQLGLLLVPVATTTNGGIPVRIVCGVVPG